MKDTLSQTFMKGTVGVVSPALGLAVSRLDVLEQWLRISALVAGITVSVATFVSILHHWRKKK